MSTTIILSITIVGDDGHAYSDDVNINAHLDPKNFAGYVDWCNTHPTETAMANAMLSNAFEEYIKAVTS